MTEARRITVKFESDTKDLKKGFDRMEKRTQNFTRTVRRLGAAFVSIFAIRKLARTFTQTLDQADTLIQTAKAAGLAADEYERLSFAFAAAKVPVDQLRQGLGDLQLRLGDTSKNYDKYYRQIGLNPNELRQQSSADQLVQTVQALGQIENQARRIGLAGRVLGEESSRQLIKLVADGGEAFERSLVAFDKYGSALKDPSNVQSIRELTFEQQKFQRQWDLFKQKATIETLPAFKSLLEKLDEKGTLEQLATDMATLVGWLVKGVEALVEFRKALPDSAVARLYGGVGSETGAELEANAKALAEAAHRRREMFAGGSPAPLSAATVQRLNDISINNNFYGVDMGSRPGANDVRIIEDAMKRGVERAR